MELKEALLKIREFSKEAIDTEILLEDQKNYVWAKVKEDPMIMAALALYAFDELCAGELYVSRWRRKNAILEAREYPNETKRGFSVIAAVKNSLDALYCGIKPIGDCDKDEIEAQANWHQRRGQAEFVRSEIFATVAKKVKGGKTARQCLTSPQLNKIIKNVQKNRKAG